ncbi:MAG: NfeD family protein [Candidatus Bathyarchaeota archaeon]
MHGTQASQEEENRLLLVKLEGTISTMSSELLKEALGYAEKHSYPVILTLNTPGGSLDATFKIVELIENSKVPVIGYVYPKGATAWSAGTYILFSTHVACMAPNTIIGSCQPVSMGFGVAQPINDTKTINALEAFLVERAKMHGRNETIAKLCIRENLNLDAEDAEKYGAVEFISQSIEDLKEKVHGLTVNTASGKFTIISKNVEVVEWSPSIRLQILKTISEPMIAFFMFMIGLYALLFGLASPGVGGEVVGGILLLLGLIGLGILGDINIGALILIVLGAILLLYELFTPGFGIIGGSGIVSLLIGSMLIMPREWFISPEWLNALILAIMIVPLTVGAFFIFASYKVLKLRRKPPLVSGMFKGYGEVIEEITPEKTGFIIYQGEYWKAKSSKKIGKGEKVIIIGKEGPVLVVEPKNENR